MSTRKTSRKRATVTQDAEASLEALAERFEGWRSTREGLSPIPEALWVAAVEAAREQGMNRVARRLRLSYYDLKRRVNSEAPAVPPTPGGEQAAFVELIAPAGPSSPTEFMVELESATGAKMRIAVKGGHAAEVMTLSRVFWELAR